MYIVYPYPFFPIVLFGLVYLVMIYIYYDMQQCTSTTWLCSGQSHESLDLIQYGYVLGLIFLVLHDDLYNDDLLPL